MGLHPGAVRALTLCIVMGSSPAARAEALLQAQTQAQAQAQAQSVPALRALVDQAWQLDPQARRIRHRRDALEAQARQVGGWTPAPGSLAVGQRSDRYLAGRGQLEWELEYAQPLWLPGQADARRQEAALALAALEADAALLRLELGRQLAEAHQAWRLAADLHALAGHRQTLAEALATDLARRYRAGEAPRFDDNLAQAELLAAQAARDEAALAEQAAEDSFRRLAGSPPPAHWPRPGQLPPPVPPQLDAPQRALDWALAQLESTRRSPRDNPELGVRLRRERDATGAEFADSLALRLSIPLESAPRQQAREADGAGAVDEAQAALARARLTQAQELRRSAAQRARALQLEAGADTRLQLAQDNLALADKAWRLGERPLESLLRTRSAFFDAEEARLRARHARAQAETAQLYWSGVAE